jgi:small subunit ribosomal protein S6
LTQIYEGMFLLDNNVVRQDWRKAKDTVKSLLEKHGGTIHTLRRWDERRLAYPVKRNNRATFFLAFYELPAESITTMRRDLDLSEDVLRYLFTCVDAVPDDERVKAAAEDDKDYLVPEPPADDAPEVEVASAHEEGRGRSAPQAAPNAENAASGAADAASAPAPAAAAAGEPAAEPTAEPARATPPATEPEAAETSKES